MKQLNEIEKSSPQILAATEFTDGNRYTDFDSKNDKIAEFGIAALVAGGAAAAAKVGLFKGLWIAILAAKKFIIIGLVAVAGAVKRFFSRDKAPKEVPTSDKAE